MYMKVCSYLKITTSQLYGKTFVKTCILCKHTGSKDIFYLKDGAWFWEPQDVHVQTVLYNKWSRQSQFIFFRGNWFCQEVLTKIYCWYNKFCLKSLGTYMYVTHFLFLSMTLATCTHKFARDGHTCM